MFSNVILPFLDHFKWSKKGKIKLETLSFWWNMSISTFKFSPFLYAIKACRWNLINFSKFGNTLIRKEKNTNTVVNEKKPRKNELFYNRLFYKVLISNNYYLYFASSFAAQFSLFVIVKKIKRGSWECQGGTVAK